MELVNVLEIKQMVKEAIYLADLLENEAGMEGDIDTSTAHGSDKQQLSEFKIKLDELQNTDLYPTMVVKSIKEYIPEMNFDLLCEYTKIAIQRNKDESQRLQMKINQREAMIEVLCNQQ